MQGRLQSILPRFFRILFLKGQCAGDKSFHACGRAEAMEMFEADVCMVVTVSLEHREDDIMVPFKSKRLAHLQLVSGDLQDYFGRSVDETVERARDDHDL